MQASVAAWDQPRTVVIQPDIKVRPDFLKRSFIHKLANAYGAVDPITRRQLQRHFLELKATLGKTMVLVTHDVDEAILLADRVVMMTNGPNARIGRIVEIDIPRPRTRKALLAHPRYYEYREAVLGFLDEFEHGATSKEKPNSPVGEAA